VRRPRAPWPTSSPSVNYAGGRSPDNESTYFGALTWSHDFDSSWSIKQRFVAQHVDADGKGLFANDIVTGAPTPSGWAAQVAQNNVINHDDNFNLTTDLTGHFNTFGLAHTLLIGSDVARFDQSGSINQACQIDANCSFVDLFNPGPGTPFSGPPTPFGASSQTTTTIGAYAQDQIKLPAGFFLLAGVRAQWINQTTNASFPAFGLTTTSPLTASALTPRAALLWQPQDWLSVYGSYTTSFGPAKGGYIQANGQGVPPSAGVQYEAGVKTTWLGGKVTATAAVFDLTKTNIPSVDPLNPNFVTVIGKIRSRGVEFDLSGEVLPGWKVIANYAHSDVRTVDSSSADVYPAGAPYGAVPIDLFHF
jgi:iron complex outermembrane receptor protein